MLTALILLPVVSAEGVLSSRQTSASSMAITNLTKNETPTVGSGAVSAAGTLSPFGGVGVGCGVNWQDGQSFGGGLQAGSDAFGLGGGMTITPDTMTIGLGIGVNPVNSNSSVSFSAGTNGTVSFVFSSTSSFTCKDTTVNGMKAVQCSSST